MNNNDTMAPMVDCAPVESMEAAIKPPISKKRRNVAEQNTVLLAALSGVGRRPVNAPPKDRKFFWSEQGEILCDEHCRNLVGTDTWRFGHWKRMSAAEVASFATETGWPTECETCAALKRKGGA